MEKKHAESRLKALEKEFNRDSAQYTKDQQEIVRAQAQVDALQVSAGYCISNCVSVVVY